jgi:uncharacterized delta-60 repeat protein
MKRTDPECDPQARGTETNHRRPLATAAWALALVATQAAASPGDLDPSFGDHGRVWVDARSGHPYGFYKVPIARQADGKIVVAGTSAGDSSVSVTRFGQDGSIDPAFGTGGTTHLDFGAGRLASINAMAIGEDGRIVLAGQVVTDLKPTTRDIVVARLNANGSPDAAFGSGGRVTLEFRPGYDNSASAVTVLPDGRIVIAAGSQQADSAIPEITGLFRLKPDGTADTGFGTAGRVIVGDAASRSRLFSVQALADGRLLTCGDKTQDKSSVYFAARLMPDGSFDPKFGSNGRSSASSSAGVAYACVVRPDGRVLLVGAVGIDSGVVQLDATGELDRAFGENGVATIRFVCNSWCSENIGLFDWPPSWFTDVVAMPDGGLVAAGPSPGGDLGVVRLDGSGHPDAMFGRDGTRVFDLGHNASGTNLSGAALLLQPDGRLIAAGLGSKTTTIIRVNMDDSPGASVVGFLPSWTYFAKEGDNIRMTLRRTGSSSGAVSVDFAAIDGTATAPTDYVAPRGAATWADGDTADKDVVVAIVRDDIAENGEAFRLVLSNPSGAGLTMSEATVDVRDAPTLPPSPVVGSTNGTPTVSGGGTGNGGGGGSTGPALLALLALLRTCAGRCNLQLKFAVRH